MYVTLPPPPLFRMWTRIRPRVLPEHFEPALPNVDHIAFLVEDYALLEAALTARGVKYRKVMCVFARTSANNTCTSGSVLTPLPRARPVPRRTALMLR